MKTLRVVQVGFAHDHAPGPIDTFRRIEGFEIIGFINDNDERQNWILEHCYKDIPHPPIITWEEAFEMKPDAFIIETCELELVENAIRALEAGYHVYMDKPGSQDTEQFHRMCEIAKEKDLVLCLGYMYRYNPAIVRAMQLKNEGKLGEIFSVEAQMSVRHENDKRAWLSRFEGGMLYFLGCHLIDLVVQFCGFPDEVHPFNCNTGVDGNESRDYGFCLYKYKNGVSFVKSCATEINGYDRRQVVITGSLGTVEIKPIEYNNANWTLDCVWRETLNNDRAWSDNSTTYRVTDYGRYDDMFKAFHSYVTGEAKNPYTYDYEAKLHDIIMQSCK